MVTTSTITPEMLRQQREDAIAHPERYPNYRDAVIRYATWALGETADVAGVDCSILGGRASIYRQIALEESVRTWNWRAVEDARIAAAAIPPLGNFACDICNSKIRGPVGAPCPFEHFPEGHAVHAEEKP